MKISELCIRRPVMTTLLMFSIALAGFFAYGQLPIAAIPRIDVPTITVSARLPGASPDTMAVSVAAPLERQFASIAGITNITSSSVESGTSITLEFNLERNIDAAALDVQSAISVATRRLPADLEAPPAFRKVNPADSPVIFLALTSDTMPSSDINEFAETVMMPRLSTLSGVGEVTINGAQKRAVRIRYNFDALASRDISVEELRLAVSRIAGVGPLGSIRTSRQVYVLETKSAQATAAYFKPVVVAWRNGAPVRLQDVADVADSVEDDQAYAELDGKRSIIISIRRQPDANTVAVTDGVRQLIPQFQKDMPPSMNLNILSDRSESIRDSVHDVQLTLFITAFLVVLVILAFLRTWRATVIPAFALPLSIVGTFAGMYYFGFSLDNVTLLALTLALGFVVDDAIIVLENIVRYVEKGMPPLEAAIKGSKEIGFTVLSITLSLVAVFIPILLMGGVVGRFFFSFAVTISMAIMFSGFIALTLTPMLCARMLSHHEPHEAKPGMLARAFESGYDGMATAYRVSLDWSLRHRGLMLMLTLGTMVATAWAFTTVKKGFLPTEDTSIIIVRTEAQSDIAFPAMLERQRLVADAVRSDPDVLYINSNVAATAFNPTINRGSIFVQLKPPPRAGRARDDHGRAAPPAPPGRRHRRHPGVPGAAAELAHRQPLRCRRLSVHAIERRPGAALYRLRPADRAAQDDARLRRRHERPRTRRAPGDDRSRSRCPRALRRLAGNAALDALFDIRVAEDRDGLHLGERLRGDRRGGKDAAARPERPQPCFCARRRAASSSASIHSPASRLDRGRSQSRVRRSCRPSP